MTMSTCDNSRPTLRTASAAKQKKAHDDTALFQLATAAVRSVYQPVKRRNSFDGGSSSHKLQQTSSSWNLGGGDSGGGGGETESNTHEDVTEEGSESVYFFAAAGAAQGQEGGPTTTTEVQQQPHMTKAQRHHANFLKFANAAANAPKEIFVNAPKELFRDSKELFGHSKELFGQLSPGHLKLPKIHLIKETTPSSSSSAWSSASTLFSNSSSSLFSAPPSWPSLPLHHPKSSLGSMIGEATGLVDADSSTHIRQQREKQKAKKVRLQNDIESAIADCATKIEDADKLVDYRTQFVKAHLESINVMGVVIRMKQILRYESQKRHAKQMRGQLQEQLEHLKNDDEDDDDQDDDEEGHDHQDLLLVQARFQSILKSTPNDMNEEKLKAYDSAKLLEMAREHVGRQEAKLKPPRTQSCNTIQI